jgi:hypothetical protein
MVLVHNIDKKRRNTGDILSIFAETMRQISDAGDGKAFNQRFPRFFIREKICDVM